HGEALFYRNVLEDGKVNITIAWATELVARKIADARSRHGKRRWVPPQRPSVRSRELVVDSRERIADQIKSQAGYVRRLPGVEVHQGTHLPSVSQQLGTVGTAGNLIGQTGSKEVPGVVIAVAVVELDVVGVIRDHSAVFADFIQSVRPGITELRG